MTERKFVAASPTRPSDRPDDLIARILSDQWLGGHQEAGRPATRMFVYKDAAERVNPIQKEVHAMLRDFGETGVPKLGAYEPVQWAAMLQTSLAQFVSTSVHSAPEASVLDLYRRVEDLTKEVSGLREGLRVTKERDQMVSAASAALPLLEDVASRVFAARSVSISVTHSDEEDFDVTIKVRVLLDDMDPLSRADCKTRFFEELFDSPDCDVFKTAHFLFSSG